MSLISQPIARRAYELIRDRICQILVEEIQTQEVLTYDTELQLKGDGVFMERMIPFDHTECPAINVGMERGDYSNYHLGQSDGDYRFFIEVNTSAVSKDGKRGDERSKVLCEKIMGVCMAIIDDPIYVTLGFAPGLIRHRHVESFVFAENTRQDSENVTMARVAVVVKAVESFKLQNASVASGYDTHVRIHDTDKGYFWSK
jgi:hypothetical protein